ncbi:hypothetical protein MIR68_005579 [Amoeboaphelidium protococcarum]|nr:hypothetical protein MIR68_005579 [Amoeboaphelidium protococcarum]
MKCIIVLTITVVSLVQSMNVAYRYQPKIGAVSSAKSVTRPRLMPLRASSKSPSGGHNSNEDSDSSDCNLDEQKHLLNLIWHRQSNQLDKPTIDLAGDMVDDRLSDLISLSTKCVYDFSLNDFTRLVKLCDTLLEQGVTYSNLQKLDRVYQRSLEERLGAIIATHIEASNAIEYFALLKMHFVVCKVMQSRPYLTLNVIRNYFRDVVKQQQVAGGQLDFPIMQLVMKRSGVNGYQEDFLVQVLLVIQGILVDTVTDVDQGQQKFYAILQALQAYDIMLGINTFTGQVQWTLMMRTNDGLMRTIPAPQLNLFAGIIYRFQYTQGLQFGDARPISNLLRGIPVRRDSVRASDSLISLDFEPLLAIIRKDNMELLNEIAQDAINGEWLSYYLHEDYVQSFLTLHKGIIEILMSGLSAVDLKLGKVFSNDPLNLFDYLAVIKVQRMFLQAIEPFEKLLESPHRDQLSIVKWNAFLLGKNFMYHTLVTFQDHQLFLKLMWQMLQPYNIIDSSDQIMKSNAWYQYTFKALTVIVADAIRAERQDIVELLRVVMQKEFDISFTATVSPVGGLYMVQWRYSIGGEPMLMGVIENNQFRATE